MPVTFAENNVYFFNDENKAVTKIKASTNSVMLL